MGSKYFLYYSGSAVSGGSLGYKLGIAYADSPLGPWTRPSSPTLDVGSAGSWDSSMLVRGCMIYNNNNGKYCIVYNGNNGATWKVGIATADPYVDQDYIQFETRTSSDNSTWEDWKPILNGSTVQSTPDKYFQYRALLNNSPLGSPVLASVTINYDTISTMLYLISSLVEKNPGDVGTTFNINVTIRDVTDLYGFDFNLTYDDSLVTLVNVDFNTTLDRIWGHNNWFIGDNQTGTGYYKLAAVSIANSFTSTGANALATLTFLVRLSNFQRETPIHFATHKLGDSHWSSIPHTAVDGTYRITGKKPTLKLTPSSVTCRKLGEVLTLTINVSDVSDLEDFKFEIHYNTTLLDCVSVVWPAWVTGTMNVDEANGNVTGYTSGSMKTGNFTLMIATFTASYYHLWKAIPGWQNNLTGTIYVQWANLSFSGMPDLRYEKGGSNQVNVDPTEVVYTLSSIQGDLDNNGSVDNFDLRTEAALYDTSNPDYNLTGDNIIDIYDLVIVAANFNYAYNP